MVSSTRRPPSPKDQRWTPSLVTPQPVNEPVGSSPRAPPSAPGCRPSWPSSPSTPTEIHHVIGGEHRRGTGPTVRRRAAAPPRERARHATTRPPRPTSPTRSRPRTQPPPRWRELSFDDRAAVFLRAADLLSGPWRETLAAATMLGQSKTAYQAEIDTPCELIDFWRFNVHFARQIIAEQPISSPGVWNRLEYRPLEGFVYADHPLQLHRDRGQPADRAGADGQHRGLEARADPGRRRVRDDEAARGRRTARRA